MSPDTFQYDIFEEDCPKSEPGLEVLQLSPMTRTDAASFVSVNGALERDIGKFELLVLMCFFPGYIDTNSKSICHNS